MNKIAYVVPTKDRPDDLRKLFESLKIQTTSPDQIIVVDGSDPDIKFVCDEFDELNITYVRCFPPSLAKQRNAGMAVLNDEITIAGYLDDDLVLEPDATEKMIQFWNSADKNIGGASMSIINQGNVNHEWFLKLFMMHGEPPGKVLPSGFACFYPFITKTIEGQWLYGGATLWKREVINEFDYDEWYLGHGYLEDLDYSYRVSKKYRLYVVGDSRTYHFSHEMAPERMFDLGRQQVFNRIYFIRKHDTFLMPAVIWGVTGQILLNLFGFIKNLHKPSLDRLRGNMNALLAVIMRRKKSFEGFWK